MLLKVSASYGLGSSNPRYGGAARCATSGHFDVANTKALELCGGFVPEERDRPAGVRKTECGKYKSEIRWRGKSRHIGTFGTPEQASAAYMSARKDLDDTKASCCANEVNSVFDASKKKALAAVKTMMASGGKFQI